MASVHIEMLVEPFKEDQPGPHVVAAVEALEQSGLSVEMGPFASTVDGDMETVIKAISAALSAGFARGADRISVSVERA